jgi:hypothetical protein
MTAWLPGANLIIFIKYNVKKPAHVVLARRKPELSVNHQLVKKSRHDPFNLSWRPGEVYDSQNFEQILQNGLK